MVYALYMLEEINIPKVLESLMAEYDALCEELATIRQEEEARAKRVQELNRKISALQQTLQGLSLYSNAQETPTEVTLSIKRILQQVQKGFAEDDKPRTLTECCREILSGDWISAVQVRQALQSAGFDFSQYTSNPLSSIHTTLKRLVGADEAEIKPDSNPVLYRRKQKRVETPEQPLNPVGRSRYRSGEVRHAAYMPASADPLTAPPLPGRINTPMDFHMPSGRNTEDKKK
jgi:hypothetical protein